MNPYNAVAPSTSVIYCRIWTLVFKKKMFLTFHVPLVWCQILTEFWKIKPWIVAPLQPGLASGLLARATGFFYLERWIASSFPVATNSSWQSSRDWFQILEGGANHQTNGKNEAFFQSNSNSNANHASTYIKSCICQSQFGRKIYFM